MTVLTAFLLFEPSNYYGLFPVVFAFNNSFYDFIFLYAIPFFLSTTHTKKS